MSSLQQSKYLNITFANEIKGIGISKSEIFLAKTEELRNNLMKTIRTSGLGVTETNY